MTLKRTVLENDLAFIFKGGFYYCEMINRPVINIIFQQ